MICNRRKSRKTKRNSSTFQADSFLSGKLDITNMCLLSRKKHIFLLICLHNRNDHRLDFTHFILWDIKNTQLKDITFRKLKSCSAVLKKIPDLSPQCQISKFSDHAAAPHFYVCFWASNMWTDERKQLCQKSLPTEFVDIYMVYSNKLWWQPLPPQISPSCESKVT